MNLVNRDIPVGSNAQIPLFATASQLVVSVTVAQPGAILAISNYPMVTDVSGSTSREICRIDLSQTGTRTFTTSAATGTKGNDSYTLSALGYAEALDFYRPTAGGTVAVMANWANSETALD